MIINSGIMFNNITSLAFFTDFLRCMTFTFKIKEAFFQPCLLLFFVFCYTLRHYLSHNKQNKARASVLLQKITTTQICQIMTADHQCMSNLEHDLKYS